jgi:hypothetical protein
MFAGMDTTTVAAGDVGIRKKAAFFTRPAGTFWTLAVSALDLFW